MKILGIDYGGKRVGVAFADTDAGLAFPKAVLENNGEIPKRIMELVKEWDVERIVIGESKNLDGNDNYINEHILSLKQALEKEGCEVILHPEMYTSLQAERMQGKNNMLDASAATIILQSYVDRAFGTLERDEKENYE